MRKRHTVAWLVALAVGLMLVPAIDAAAASRSASREQVQNHRITRVVRQARDTTLKVASVAGKLGNLDKIVAGNGQKLIELDALTKNVDGRLKGIEASVPAVLDALTKLKDGLTAAAAGLNSLKTLATSQEYGFGQLLTSTGGPPTAEAGSFIETPDIPDTVQQAMTEQQFVAQHNGVLIVLYGVRSNESDGTGASNPAANCKVTVTNKAGTTQTTAANPNFGGLPFQPVPNKSAMTSTDPANAGFPFGLKQNGTDADQTVTFASTVAVAAGDTYTVGLSCVDTSPSSSDPSA